MNPRREGQNPGATTSSSSSGAAKRRVEIGGKTTIMNGGSGSGSMSMPISGRCNGSSNTSSAARKHHPYSSRRRKSVLVTVVAAAAAIASGLLALLTGRLFDLPAGATSSGGTAASGAAGGAIASKATSTSRDGTDASADDGIDTNARTGNGRAFTGGITASMHQAGSGSSLDTLRDASATVQGARRIWSDRGSCQPSGVQLLHLEEEQKQRQQQGIDTSNDNDNDNEAVQDIFNCASPTYGLCTYYNPDIFFSPCGPGHDHVNLINETQYLLRRGDLWLNMPKIGHRSVSLPRHATTPQSPPRNLTVIHVHKAGGTSVKAAIEALLTQQDENYEPWSFFRPGRTIPVIRPRHLFQPWGTEFDRKEAMEVVGTATTYPHPNINNINGNNGGGDGGWGPTDHMLFAIVRDPLDRFVSAIGQAMGASGSEHNGVAPDFRNLCIRPGRDATSVLRCCAYYVRGRSTFVELHFTPQALIIAFATLFQNVEVALFQFESLPAVLSELGQDPSEKRR